MSKAFRIAIAVAVSVGVTPVSTAVCQVVNDNERLFGESDSGSRSLIARQSRWEAPSGQPVTQALVASTGSEVTAFEHQAGSSILTGTIVGAVAGAVVGALIGYTVENVVNEGPEAGEGTLYGALIGFGVGAGLGALVGWLASG